MRSLISLVTIVMIISCAVSSTRAQTCFRNTTKLNGTAVVSMAQDLLQNTINVSYTSLGGNDSVSYINESYSVQICTVNFNTQPDNVTVSAIGMAALVIINHCCPNVEDCKGGIYAYTGPTQYGLLSYVVPYPDLSYSACPPWSPK